MVERFEELAAWQKARELVRAVYEVTNEGSFARDFGLRDQVRRAAVSTMANIAEGFERNRPNEFHQFLSMAKASCGEVRSHLYVALDAGYLQPSQFELLSAQAIEMSKVVAGLRSSIDRYRQR